jgi:putative oxidoreductase
MKELFRTSDAVAPLLSRLFLAVVMFPHGAQKVLGWFGGQGPAGTMQFFTETLNIPAPLAVLAIAVEFLAPIALLLGLLTRLAALSLAIHITVAALMVHVQHGFFMNWYGQKEGEGFEYHILFLGLALVPLLQGGGRWALDQLIYRRLTETTAGNKP